MSLFNRRLREERTKIFFTSERQILTRRWPSLSSLAPYKIVFRYKLLLSLIHIIWNAYGWCRLSYSSHSRVILWWMWEYMTPYSRWRTSRNTKYLRFNSKTKIRMISISNNSSMKEHRRLSRWLIMLRELKCMPLNFLSYPNKKVRLLRYFYY